MRHFLWYPLHVSRQTVPPAKPSADQAAVDAAAAAITGDKLTALQEAFTPELANGTADIDAGTTEITLDAAKVKAFKDQFSEINAEIVFKAPKDATAEIKLENGKYTVKHGTADEQWNVVVVLMKGEAEAIKKIGTYTIKAKAGGTQPTKTALSVADANIAHITVDGAAVSGSAGNYTVALEASKFDALAAGADTTKVVIGAAAITGLASGDTPATVFDVMVADASPNKIVTISLKSALQATYEFTNVTITVTKS